MLHTDKWLTVPQFFTQWLLDDMIDCNKKVPGNV